jgi:hypothetical protein
LTIFLILLLAALVAWWFYRRTVPRLSSHRRWLLLALRALMLGVVLLLLLNPVLRRDYTHRVKPDFWLLRDVSASRINRRKRQQGRLFSDTLDESRKRCTPPIRPRGAGLCRHPGRQRRNGTGGPGAGAGSRRARRGAPGRRCCCLDGWLKDETQTTPWNWARLSLPGSPTARHRHRTAGCGLAPTARPM